MKKGRPLFGILSVILSGFAVIAPFVVDPQLAYEIEINIAPPVVAALVVLAFIRRERVIFPIISIMLVAFYIALRFIATA
jgi:hypothetical protein